MSDKIDDWKKFDIEDNRMEFMLLNKGQVESYYDNTYKFVKDGSTLSLRRRDFFGIEFVIVSNKIYEFELELRVHHPDYEDERDIMKVKNNIPYMISQGFLTEHHMKDGEWTLDVSMKQRRMWTENEERIEYGLELQESFMITCIPPEDYYATDEDIAEAEELLNTKFIDEYKTFLKTQNGYELDWTLHKDLTDLYKQVGPKQIRKLAKKAGIKEHPTLLDDIEYLYAIKNERHLELLGGGAKNHYYDIEFGRFFYPIGANEDGDKMIQIAAGKHAGKLGVIKRKVFYVGMHLLVDMENHDDPDVLEYLEEMDVPFENLKTADVDTVIDYCVESGFIAIYDRSLQQFIEARKVLSTTKVEAALNAMGMGADPVLDQLDALMDAEFEEVEEKKSGSFVKTGDGYKIKEKGKKLVLTESDHFGFQFKIRTKKEGERKAVGEIKTPSGETVKKEFMVVPNSLATFSYCGSEDGHFEKGEYSFKLKFPKSPFLDLLKKKIKVK